MLTEETSSKFDDTKKTFTDKWSREAFARKLQAKKASKAKKKGGGDDDDDDDDFGSVCTVDTFKPLFFLNLAMFDLSVFRLIDLVNLVFNRTVR